MFTACLKGWVECDLVGVDGSPYAIQQAKKMGFDDLYLVQDFSFDRLPFQDATFDFVINKDVLEHLLKPEVLVAEMARVTKPGGHLLILVPNHFPIAGRLHLLFHNNIDSFGFFPNSHRWDFPHIRFFNKADLIMLIESHGLKAVSGLSHHFPAFPRVGRLMTKSMKRYLSSLNPDAFAEAFVWLFKKV